MKAGDWVMCRVDAGAEAWLSRGAAYEVEAVVGFGDQVVGSGDEGVFYGSPEDVGAVGLILYGVDATYHCGGRMAFRADRFVGEVKFMEKMQILLEGRFYNV